MTELGEGTEVMFGLGASFADLNPELEDSTVTPTPPVVSGNNAGGFAPMLGSFLSHKLPFNIHFGMATILPYAGGSTTTTAGPDAATSPRSSSSGS
jgi:hypothetical protein